jgi:SAM-dependent methyltransferase
MTPATLSRFREAYGAHRAAEGRRHDRAELLALPYLASGQLARQWAVRARTFDAFIALVLAPAMRRLGRPIQLIDLGAGNGWLCRRAVLAGCEAVAVDIRDDDVDGLGAAMPYLENGRRRFDRVVATFDDLPVADGRFDIAVFNASLHYATDLAAALREARRVVRDGGRIVILDSPFYGREANGEAMVAEKRRTASATFGAHADVLMSIPAIEYLTARRLTSASEGLGLDWRRHRVWYPLWYELRTVSAWLRRRRTPSRFDLWEAAAR